jgi:ribonuclease E
VTDGGPSSEVPGHSSQHEELPDRLRVHALARALGTTSRQVLDALTELDGRIRSAHSTVERVDAVRVRDLLASAPATVAAPVGAAQVDVAAEAEEPESRLLLATPDTAAERPAYMPLFVAPQPVERVVKTDNTVDSDDSGPTDDSDESDDDSDDSDDPDDSDDNDDNDDERPANKRRRRGRRGRGRGRGELNGAETGDGGKQDGGPAENSDDDSDDDDTDDADSGDDDNGSGEGANKRRRRRRRRKSGSSDDNDDNAAPDDAAHQY